jgi:hypothetical protein
VLTGGPQRVGTASLGRFARCEWFYFWEIDLMKRNRWTRWAALAALAVGANFQLGQCTLSPEGVFSSTADLLGLADLRNQLFESSPFGQVFEGMTGMGQNGEAE